MYWQNHLIDGNWWSDIARTRVQYLAIDYGMWDKENEALELCDYTALKEFTLVVHKKDESGSEYDSDKCVETWRMDGSSLAFEEPRKLEDEIVHPEQKLFIEEWRNIVLEKMEEELDIAVANSIEWSIPNINIKILTRKGVRCAGGMSGDINELQADIVDIPLGIVTLTI